MMSASKCNTSTSTSTSTSEVRPLLSGYDSDGDFSYTVTPESACQGAKSQSSSTHPSTITTQVWHDKHDFNKNVLDIRKNQETAAKTTLQHNLPTSTVHPKPSKYAAWSWKSVRRKHLLSLLVAALLILYVNSTLVNDEIDERIPVLHFSHVPGMKEASENTTTAAVNASIGTIAAQDRAVNVTQLLNSKIDGPQQRQLTAINTILPSTVTEYNTLRAAPVYASAASFASAVTLKNKYENHSIPNNYSTSTSFATNVSVVAMVATNASDAPSAIPHNTTNVIAITAANVMETISTLPPGYLVWSDYCKMPNIDPYLREVMKHFKRQSYTPCSKMKPLTRVEYNASSQRYVLQINKDAIKSYSTSGVLDCCYQSIERNATGISADTTVGLGVCMGFVRETSLAPTIDNILVKCKAKKKSIYVNAHAMMPERQELRQRLEHWKQIGKQVNDRPSSVLMIGIDSISRINFIRAMPKTAQYMYDNEWFEMSGYNKMDDNTFPNIMALLTGLNQYDSIRKCPPTKLRGLDNCTSMLWHTFRQHGYVTAYGEDEASISTFNYLKKGFEQPPVDYYLRPYFISAESELPVKQKSGLSFCVGYKHEAEVVYDYAVELASRYKNDSFFGFFWTNTFSHNAISDPSFMDERIVEYFKKFATMGTLDNTIVIFFSDHGMRFGPTRPTPSGYLEERLPFLFLWIPQHLKQAHPEFVNALSVNKNRLTNPYDLHMTLKHILSMTGRVKNETLLEPAKGCPRCQTLLEPVPHSRSCEDIAIENHWCTCMPYQSIYKNSKTVQKVTKGIVDHINKYISKFQNGSISKLCLPLKVYKIESAARAQYVSSHKNSNSSAEEIYRIVFYTSPNKGLFEATAEYNTINEKIEVRSGISRLNFYGSESSCVADNGPKKFCVCRKKKH